jgi:hypothetical protein
MKKNEVIMKTLTTEWIHVMMIMLVATALFLLILALVFSVHTHLFASVGWHDLASVGWVTAPG